MYSVAAQVPKLDFYMRLNMEFRSDFCWWDTFLTNWSRVSFLQVGKNIRTHAIIQTDASGSWGCGAHFSGRWFQWRWPLACGALQHTTIRTSQSSIPQVQLTARSINSPEITGIPFLLNPPKLTCSQLQSPSITRDCCGTGAQLDVRVGTDTHHA